MSGGLYHFWISAVPNTPASGFLRSLSRTNMEGRGLHRSLIQLGIIEATRQVCHLPKQSDLERSQYPILPSLCPLTSFTPSVYIARETWKSVGKIDGGDAKTRLNGARGQLRINLYSKQYKGVVWKERRCMYGHWCCVFFTTMLLCAVVPRELHGFTGLG